MIDGGGWVMGIVQKPYLHIYILFFEYKGPNFIRVNVEYSL